MTKKELLESALADVADDELLFIVRGSHPAAPETLREYARRVLHYQRIRAFPPTLEGAKIARESAALARTQADDAFDMANRMEAQAVHQQRMEDERRAGLTAAAVTEEDKKLLETLKGLLLRKDDEL